MIEWREGNAEQLPFHDGAFDLVLCQFALMFVADKVAALSEMRRVITGSGRVLISVWQGLDRHPFYQTLHNVIQQRLGMSALQEIFALGNADDLRELALAAGFRKVDMKPFFPSRHAFQILMTLLLEKSRLIPPRSLRCSTSILMLGKQPSQRSPEICSRRYKSSYSIIMW